MFCRYEEGTVEEVRAAEIGTLELPSPESETAFASVSAKAIAARAEVLCACAAVLSKGMRTLDFRDYLRPGSMANALYSNACARGLVEHVISNLFDEGLGKVKRDRGGEFPTFQVNRGILPADQRKRSPLLDNPSSRRRSLKGWLVQKGFITVAGGFRLKRRSLCGTR